MLVCKGCGREFRSTLATNHLKKCLGLTRSEYKMQYPDAILDTADYLASIAITELNMIKKYGEVTGKEKWISYCNKQAKTNTFEYKKEKYGWSECDFIEYNKSRAITELNMIKKYGEVTGKEKWISYCNKQAVAGVTLDYFIEKYGEDIGKSMWDYQLFARGRSLPFFIQKYGEDLGLFEFKKSWELSSGGFASKSSQKFFDELSAMLPADVDSYYKSKNKEFGKFGLGRYYFYDYVIPSIKICIEYNGDHWHANPSIYEEHEVPKMRGNKLTSGQIWKNDEDKINVIQDAGFDVIIVWESEYKSSKKLVLEKLCNLITQKLEIVKSNA
jgi:hypothetical protein